MCKCTGTASRGGWEAHFPSQWGVDSVPNPSSLPGMPLLLLLLLQLLLSPLPLSIWAQVPTLDVPFVDPWHPRHACQEARPTAQLFTVAVAEPTHMRAAA